MNGKVVFFLTDKVFLGKYSALGDWGELLISTKLGPFTWFSPLGGATVLHVVLASVTVNIYSLHFRDFPSSGDPQRFRFQAGISTAKKPPSGTGLPDCQELCGWWMWEQQIEGPVQLKQPPTLPGYCSSNAAERQGRLFQVLIFFNVFSLAYIVNCFFSHLFTYMLLLCHREPAS